MPVLVAPAAFAGLHAPAVAAAIGRGLERAGLPPPDLCPVAGGGRGTIEVLLPALGGETGDGFVLIEDGGTAIVELGVDGRATGARIARAIDAGAQVVLVAAGGSGGLDGGAGVAEGVEDVGAPGGVEASRDGRGAGDVEAIACGGGAGGVEANACAGGAGGVEANACAGREGGGEAIACAGGADAIDAIEDKGGLRGAALVVLCETRAAWTGPTATLPRDPRDVPMTAAGDGLAGALWARYDAQLLAGPAFVLEQLGFDARMRAARAVVAGEARLDRGTLAGRVAGEVAIRARQAGVPCHAVAARNALDPFDVRILDLQAVVEARTIEELEAAGEHLAGLL